MINFLLIRFRGVGIFQIGDETVEVDGNKEPTLGKFIIFSKTFYKLKFSCRAWKRATPIHKSSR